jgi:hypothetical protein
LLGGDDGCAAAAEWLVKQITTSRMVLDGKAPHFDWFHSWVLTRCLRAQKVPYGRACPIRILPAIAGLPPKQIHERQLPSDMPSLVSALAAGALHKAHLLQQLVANQPY